MSSLRQDLRYALRALARRPGFALVIVSTLAVALGANTTMMALVDAVLLRPLPFAEAERLVALWDSRPEDGDERWRVSTANFLAWREQNEAFERLALYAYDERTMAGEGDPVQLFGSRVTANFFPLLGVEPLLGRTFAAADFTEAAEPAIVLSHGLWTRRLGGDEDVVGETITLDSLKYTVVGVLPRQLMPLVAWHSGRLEFASAKEHYWIPYADLEPRHGHTNGVLGKLAAGVGLTQARLQMETIARRLEAEHPRTNKGFQVRVAPLREEAVGDVRASLWLVFGAVGLLLAVACGNVANLLLARVVERRKELAVRAALGAGRLRIWRQVATEGALLAAAGAVLGTALAVAGLRLVPHLVPREIPRLDEAGLDLRTLAATLGLCLLAGLLCSLVPAFQAGRTRLEEVLRAGGRDSGGRRSGAGGGARLSRFLVAAEMALAVTLVLGALERPGAGRLCGGGDAAGDSRPLGRLEPGGGAAFARDRDPHGARRRPPERLRLEDLARARAGVRGARRRYRRGAGPGAAAAFAAV